MKEFFKSELKTLQAKTGLKQYENLSAMPDAEFQFKILLDSMVHACNEFPYIPDNDKKRIIQDSILKEPDLTGLNSRMVWKWLNANKDHYWAVHNAKQSETAARLVTFDELPKKLQDEINEFKVSLLTNGPKSVPKVTESEIEAIRKEDELIQEGLKATGATIQEEHVKRYYEIEKRKKEAVIKRGLDKVNIGDLKRFEVEDQKILARTQEEAEEMYIEIYV